MKYVLGKFLKIAYTLFRAFDQTGDPTDNDMHHDMEHFIHNVVTNLPISDVKLMELRELNHNYPNMQMLHRYALGGWPEHMRDVPSPLKSLWDVRNDIHVTDGILLKDIRLIISSVWRNNILQKLHISHCGIEKTKTNARTTVFWPGMTMHIEEMVASCEKCMKYQIKLPKETWFQKFQTVSQANVPRFVINTRLASDTSSEVVLERAQNSCRVAEQIAVSMVLEQVSITAADMIL